MKTALLIDEDPVLRHSLAQWLGQAGWIVLEAGDGAAGLSIALEKKPVLILCDLLAPRFNGFQLCRFLRAKPDKLPGTRIIVTASGGYGVDRETAFQAGADDCIVKPILQADLLRLLRALPESSGQTQTIHRPEAVLRFDDPIPPLPHGAAAARSPPPALPLSPTAATPPASKSGPTGS
jgi:DNA-binding response OmpR family regulator